MLCVCKLDHNHYIYVSMCMLVVNVKTFIVHISTFAFSLVAAYSTS